MLCLLHSVVLFCAKMRVLTDCAIQYYTSEENQDYYLHLIRGLTFDTQVGQQTTIPCPLPDLGCSCLTP